MMRKDYDEIEKAIYFLADCIREEKRTGKPLMLHCTRVGLKLLDNNQPTAVVVAGFLHDTLEDTNCTRNDLKDNFGNRVAELVQNCTFRPEREDLLRTSNITNYQEEWGKEFDIMDSFDNEALVIKAADISDNSSLVSKIENKDQKDNLVWKHREFVRRFKNRLQNNLIFQELEQIVSDY